MKKKQYIAPCLKATEVTLAQMTCASITAVGGDAGITLGDGDTPDSADGRRGGFSVWDDDED